MRGISKIFIEKQGEGEQRRMISQGPGSDGPLEELIFLPVGRVFTYLGCHYIVAVRTELQTSGGFLNSQMRLRRPLQQ